MSEANQQSDADAATQGQVEGSIPDLVNPVDLQNALEKGFDYRGDVTIVLRNGEKIEGYIFDRSLGNTLEASFVRLLPKSSPGKIRVAYSDIAALVFSGRDTAAGKSWEAWLRKYWEKKAAGEKGIALQPEPLE